MSKSKQTPRMIGPYRLSHRKNHKSLVEFLGTPSNKIISIDETGFYIGDTGRRGYSKRGHRLNIHRPLELFVHQK